MKKVIVIGGGFAGSLIAKKLEKKFDVSLVDTKNYFEFTPGILRTIVKPEHIKKIQVLHTHYLKRAKVIVGEVKKVGKNFVNINGKKVRFDYLAICAGSSYNAPFKDQRVVIATRANELRDCYKKLCESKKILIIGGGLVGVELAGEISWKYGGEKKVTIVHSKDRLIERNSEKACRCAEDFLKKRGVRIIFNEKIIEIDKGICISNKDSRIKADMIFLCTGILPNCSFMKNCTEKQNNRNFIKVNDYLQMENVKNIFVAGDINNLKVEKTAQNAEKQGRIVAHNICALEEGEGLTEYEPKKTPLVISLGKYNGLFVYRSFTLTGKIPALMKYLIEKREMMKKRKI